MYNKLYYNCIYYSFLFSFIHIETDILGVTKLREKQKET